MRVGLERSTPHPHPTGIMDGMPVADIWHDLVTDCQRGGKEIPTGLAYHQRFQRRQRATWSLCLRR